MVSLFSGADATSVTQTNAPQWLKDYYENLAKENRNTFGIAKNIYNSNTQYQPYTGARVQGFGQDQLEAMQRVRDSLGIGGQNLAAAQSRLGLGSRSISDVVGAHDAAYRPNAVQTENYNQSYRQGGVLPQYGTADTVTGRAQLIGPSESMGLGRFSTADAQAYMNPYTNTVIQNTLGEMNRQNAIGRQADNATATAAKAFGGSRHGVMEAERARNFTQEQNNVIGNLNNQSFMQAQGQFNQDTGRLQQNNQFNAQQGLNMQLANQDAINRGLLADQSAINQMNQFNSAQGFNAQLANEGFRQNAFNINRDTFNQNQDRQFATQTQNQNMGLQAYNANRDQFNTDQARILQGGGLAMQLAPLQQQMQMQDNNNLLNIGGMQQNLGQMGLDTRYQDFLNQKQYPYQQFNFLQGALQGQNFNPYQGLAGSTTTQSGGGPSPISQIAGLGLTALGAYNAFF